jgi:hypothetical protein
MKIPNGKLLQGAVVNRNKVQAVTTLNQIEDYGLIRPTVIDKASKGHSAQEAAAHALHSVTNRSFDKARRDNASDYSGYIEAVEVHGRPGGCPAITLYHPDPLTIHEEGVIIPYNARIVAIDGETQTEARYLLRDRLPDTGDNPIAATLYHGISPQEAQQILHDYNVKGLPWTEKKAFRFNQTGPLSEAAHAAIELAGMPTDMVNYQSAKATNKTVVSLTQILTLLAGYQLNGAGAKSNVTASQLKRLNSLNSVSVPPSCTQQLAHILRRAATDRTFGNAPTRVWQMAGVLLSKNVPYTQLSWESAVDAFAETKTWAVHEQLNYIEESMRQQSRRVA